MNGKAVYMENEKASFSILVTNTGKTPAMHVRTQMGGAVVAKGQTPTVPFDEDSPNGLGGDGVILPNGQVMMVTYSEKKLSKEKIEPVRSGEEITYIYGRMEYKDVFGKLHHTKFCFAVQPDLTTLNPHEGCNSAD